MPDYGLTPNGPNIKRLDVILDDMHKNLSEKWGVNTRQNPESVVNHLLTNIADAIAELWEFGENIYYSQYPSTAEGTSLDHAAQFGGSTREMKAKSYYPIHCTGIDGTRLIAGTTIASTTNPATMLTISEDRIISRDNCNSAVIQFADISTGSIYSVAINGTVYDKTFADMQPSTLLQSLAAKINSDDTNTFSASVDTAKLLLTITDNGNRTSTNKIVLSENLTTDTVTSVINFGTEEYDDIYLPDGVITNIIRADVGLKSVINQCGYIAGRKQETDEEFRQSYVDKIFNRSSMMLESIRSSLLNEDGVTAVAVFENNTNSTVTEGAVVTVVTEASNEQYVVAINGHAYTYTSGQADQDSILTGIAALIAPDYTVTVDTGEHTLTIEFDQALISNTVTASNKLGVQLLGRPPHSIEVVVEGGDSTKIAKQIFDKKAAGIQTYGDVEVTIPGQYDEDIIIRFNRPERVYVWFKIVITPLPGDSVPSNYYNLIKNVILERMAALNTGDEVIPQSFMSELYRACPGISYIDIKLYHTVDPSVTPEAEDFDEYGVRSVTITARQRAFTEETMIEVALDG